MPEKPDIGSVATNVTSSSTEDLAKVVTAGSEAAGVGESVASIEKFKLHKDNPTQLPVGRKI
jgi:intracellular multiplication protein IcmD